MKTDRAHGIKADKSSREFLQDCELPQLLLHCCCAPCSSHVLEILSVDFRVTAFFFNPNIYPKTEYEKRRDELVRLLRTASYQTQVVFLEGDYSPELFEEVSEGMENMPEGQERCRNCISLRFFSTARTAAKLGIGVFASTLTVSPRKDTPMVNSIGEEAAEKFGVFWLPGNYKKSGGWQNSVLLSKKFGLYRQKYCGCAFSLREAEKRSEVKR